MAENEIIRRLIQVITILTAVLDIMRVIHAFRRWKRKRKSAAEKNEKPDPPCFISRLPVEILTEIANILPSRSKLCLTLSCKSFMKTLDASGQLLRSPEFQHPQEQVTPLHYWNRKHIFTSERWKLLKQLEDDKWYCCAGCQKLHPASDFREDTYRWGAEERTCKFGPQVGIVHLCPCIKMTFRDKLKLRSVLKQFRWPKISGSMLAHPQHWHECCYKYSSEYGSVTVKLKVTPTIETSGNLIIISNYSISGPSLCQTLLSVRRLCCQHRSIFYYIIDLYNLQGAGNQQYRRIMTCKWCSTVFQIAELGEELCTFTTIRSLGAGTCYADETWYKQTDVAFETLDVERRIERSPWKTWLNKFRTELRK